MKIVTMSEITPIKDKQTVTSDWQSVRPQITGVVIKRLPPIEDERGEICEVYRPSWGIHEAPLVYVYQITIRPGKVKVWGVHQKKDDRIFLSRGVLRLALFDNRSESPTFKLLNVFTISERNRALIVIPLGVYHAIQNIGKTEAVFISMPTEAYNHEDPDKYRLPLKNDLIPFSFESELGW